jgi:soluble lytic murein transglycosylase-like protein
LFIARKQHAGDMQNKQKNHYQSGCRAGCLTRPIRLAGMAMGVLALSFASVMHAAEAPLTADASATSGPASIDTPSASQVAPADGNAAALLGIATIVSGQFRVARAESLTIARAVLDAANRFAMSPVLLLGVIATESGFNRRAVSSAGAKGLMQVLPSAHPQLLAGGKDLCDPAVNVTIGSTILRGYLDDSGGDLASALSRYSGGGKGYAQRVALNMRQFSTRLHGQPDSFVKVAVVEPR